MTDALELVGSLDQPIPLAKQDETFSKVDRLLERALEERDPMIALTGASQLLGIARISGLALSKLLHGVHDRWDEYENNGDDFRDTVFETIGLTKATTDRYINVWEMLTCGVVPTVYVEDIKSRPMRDLVKVASLTAQGFDVKSEDWARMAHAADGTELDQIVRELKGKPPRKSSLQIYVERNGDINCMKEGRMKLVGYLKTDDDDPDVRKAIERIIKNAGLVER